ncbi:hypothetical protein J1N35_003769 [Gossypium stocksii]|uniref:RNase H type-1 domain-containing protein n=1 Tax=Gossypium stocksii TaxID=47602 RepID=A0A9D3WA71_9ROSI|nr:hypothetical protein J1N35_003769 [Gossypium stocksii]
MCRTIPIYFKDDLLLIMPVRFVKKARKTRTIFYGAVMSYSSYGALLKSADVCKRQLLIISLWALWYRRNKLVYEGIVYSKQELIGFIRGYYQEVTWSHEHLQPFPMSMKQSLWRPPVGETIKLNFDVSFLRESRISIAAILARNSEGLFMGACTYRFDNVADVAVAEARACFCI